MNGRLKKRGVLALIIYFLMITAIFAPIAFYTGKARSAVDPRSLKNPGAGLSQNETESDGAGLPISLAMALGEDRNTGQANAPDRNSAGRASKLRAPSMKPSVLRDAVIRAVSDTTSNEAGQTGGNDEPPSPFSLAMAPDMSSGLIKGGATPPGAGYPGAIIPGFLAANGQTSPGPNGPDFPASVSPEAETPGLADQPPLVTPVPAALPLMMTGFAGLLTFGRRARR